jgi:hypothetical protein
MELVCSQRAESNRNRTNQCAEPARRTVGRLLAGSNSLKLPAKLLLPVNNLDLKTVAFGGKTMARGEQPASKYRR